ncbi:beta-1,3-galactosyltransferase 1-like [Patiria miniata]|uniref:Hexosyltransferase n=1 Tax=Patiria miniata TaxID=46514 RepID=A0A913Z8K0_PATMI|nr:beta-1,3-galactosyltransferase 1-like [Patiria miniata]
MNGRKWRKKLRRKLALVIFTITVGCCLYMIPSSPRTPSRSLESPETEESLTDTDSDDTQPSHHQPLYSDDIINPHPYKFTIANPTHCEYMNDSDGGQLFLLILVKSAPGDVYDRQQIRRTWGGTQTVSGRLTSTLFLLGLNRDPELNRSVREESERYNDIVQENFLDAYQNLTIKNIMGMKWVATYCPNATYVASADADVMLNTFNLVRRLLDKPRHRYAEGSLRKNSEPVRKPHQHNHKWLTSKELYPEATYAPFFPGSCFVMSGDVAADIYYESPHVRFLPWDDVFIGLVMKRIGIEPWHGKGYEQYVRLNSNKAITRALMRGICVLIRHQLDGVDEKLVELWKAAVAKSQIKYQSKPTSVLQTVLLFTAISMFLVLLFSLVVAIMLLTSSDGKHSNSSHKRSIRKSMKPRPLTY